MRERETCHNTTTKIVPAYRSRSLQMTIFWRNKAREREREENDVWGKKKGEEMRMGWGERRRKHSPGHIKDKKKKTNRKTCLTWRRWFLWWQTMAACGLARPNRPVWAQAPARVTAVRTSNGGSPLWENSLKGPQRAHSASSCWLLPLLFIFWELDEPGMAEWVNSSAVFLWQRWREKAPVPTA